MMTIIYNPKISEKLYLASLKFCKKKKLVLKIENNEFLPKLSLSKQLKLNLFT